DGPFRCAAGGGHGDRHDLVGEPALGPGAGDPGLGGEGEGVLFLAGEGVLAAQVLRGLDHAAGDRVVASARGLAGPVEAVPQFEAAGPDALADAERVVLDLAHRLHTAGDDRGGGARGDGPGRVEDGLEAGAAAAVELESGDRGAESGVQGGDPADGGVLAAGVAVAEHDVVDVALGEPGAV